MKIIRSLSQITSSLYQPFHRLAVPLALALGLFAVTGTARAIQYNWTNTTGAAFNDPNAWSPVGGPGGAADIANFASVAGTFDVPLTNNFSGIGSLQLGAPGAGQQLVVTLDFGTNTFAGFSGTSSSASGFVFGQQSGSTAIVYIAVGTMYCTNTAASPSNARLMVGRNGPAYVNLTNGTVIAGNLDIANGTGANGSKCIVSGANSFWSNSTTIAVGNAAGSANCSLIVSNSGSMVALSTIQMGNAGYFNSLLLDTGGRLFIRNVGSIGSSGGSTNNSAVVQGGGLWDCGGQKLFVGNASGPGNSFTVGNNGTVSNLTFVFLTGAGNSVNLLGGSLKTTAGITNTSGTVSGFGTIGGNVVFAGTGTLSGGSGTTVGTLTVGNNLTLVSGSTTILKLDNSQTGSNDQLSVAGTLTEAGTLTVITNGIAPLNIGDQYQLFVGTQAGTFTTITLPSLDPSKLWNTNQLASAGILGVTFMPVVPGMIGPTGQVDHVYGSTVNISATVTGVPTPTVQWEYNGANIVDGPTGNGGTFSGTTFSSLTILNSQPGDTGNYCLIASNSAGVATNCMSLTVSTNPVPPSISGMSDQTVIQGNDGIFNASVAGFPSPDVQWQENGVDIPGATGVPLILTNVQFSQDGFLYTLIATNVAGSATNSATLHVIIAPLIQTQPQSLIVTNTQSACFTVVSTNGVPAPTYQWYFNNSTLIPGATNATYCIASASPANDGNYRVQISNTAGEITSSNASLTVDSTMAATLTPGNAAVNVCYDTPLFMAFNTTPVLTFAGKVNIYNVTNPATPVDTIDTHLGAIQSRTIGTEVFNSYPVIVNGNTVQIYPHLGVLSSNQQYFVTVDAGIFTDTNGALYAGIASTNGWTFTTKPTGPANPNNVVVAADENGDFATVQGAVDSLPVNNVTPTLVNIRNGTYTEIVDTKGKNNITFRGQDRAGTVVGYANNNTLNGTTHSRMAFKIYANDLAIENMTVVNTTPQGGSQSEAIMLETGAARFILNNAVVSSRQDTILANVNSSQGYFYKSLVYGNFDYIWGGGNLFVTNCDFQTIPTASSYNLAAPRTDNGPTPGGWRGPDGNYASNGISFVNCLLTRTSSTVTNITMSDGNGSPDGVASWIYCSIDVSNNNGYITPIPGVLSSQILWQYGNSNLDNSAAVDLGLTTLTNGDPRLLCAGSATCWLYGWVPQLAPNILTNPVSMTVTAGMTATFNIVATGVPDPSYQWLLNGTNVINATANNATLVISNALAGDAGTYAVIVSNIAGTVTSSNATLTVVGTGPTAGFTASPTSGTEPLSVTFSDISTGSPNITLFWDFGDGSQATNAGGSSFVHTYAAGLYTVTLTASNAFGANSTLQSNNLISVTSVFATWQQNYGLTNAGCTVCDGNSSYTGDGMSNTNKFLAGFNPTNSAAYLHVISIATINNGQDVQVTYLGANGDSTSPLGSLTYTNILDFTTGSADGGYSSINFASTGVTNILSGGDGSGVVTNMVDPGGATNVPSRYYRVRVLVP